MVMMSVNPLHSYLKSMLSSAMPSDETSWYIIQQDTGHCEIYPGGEVDHGVLSMADGEEAVENTPKIWGPFASEGEAIARRVGLIRAGKCKPYMG